MIVKRIDNLGRINIPKDFRNMLHIEDNDYISMDCNGKQITIENVNFKDKFNIIIEDILIPLYKTYGYKIIFFNKKEVLYSTDEKLNNIDINNSLKKYFNLIPEIFTEMHLSIADDYYFNKVSYIFPFLKNSYAIGIIIINSEDNLDPKELKFIYNLINK